MDRDVSAADRYGVISVKVTWGGAPWPRLLPLERSVGKARERGRRSSDRPILESGTPLVAKAFMEVIDALSASCGMQGYRGADEWNAKGEHVIAVILAARDFVRVAAMGIGACGFSLGLRYREEVPASAEELARSPT